MVSDSQKQPIDLIPLDVELMSRLPMEGTVVALRPVVASAKGIVAELNELLPREEHLTPKSLIGRLHRLHVAGYIKGIAVAVRNSAGSKGWQLTQAGRERLEAEGVVYGETTAVSKDSASVETKPTLDELVSTGTEYQYPWSN